MSTAEIPNFAELLAPALAAVPPEALPALLCGLERTAAERYREWATAAPAEYSAGLLACAAREDEIADRVEALFTLDEAARKAVEGAIPKAKSSYAEVFRGLAIAEQIRIQASAERQGAAAWRGMASQQTRPELRAELEACVLLEEQSADHLDHLLETNAIPSELR